MALRRLCLVGAAAAPAEDLKMVLNVAESVLVGDVVGPPLDGGAFDLDGASAVAADEVVVAHRATSVSGFAVVGAVTAEWRRSPRTIGPFSCGAARTTM